MSEAFDLMKTVAGQETDQMKAENDKVIKATQDVENASLGASS